MVHASAKACYSGARGRTVHRQHDNSKGNFPRTFRASYLERHRKRITDGPGTGNLMSQLADKSGQVDPSRDHTLTGMERHVPSGRTDGARNDLPYPMRTIITKKMIDDMMLSSGARSRDLQGHDNHISIPINCLLRLHQTRH